ncbi:hypothetical protein LUZ60_002717 [Juncus effusus]|nr:hypothetical protein LUZ60_002717 [Juncus effusus]
MPCLGNELGQAKVPSIQCKSLPTIIRNACTCLRKSHDLNSEDEDTFYDLETKRMILKEIRGRAIKSKSKSNDFIYSNNFTLSFFPSINNKKNQQKKEDLEETYDNEDESEAFFSVKSNFSHCSSQSATGSWEAIKDHRMSVLEEFKDCDGWPFGLCRRALVRLPPLPSTPADSWMWRKRSYNVAVKATT